MSLAGQTRALPGDRTHAHRGLGLMVALPLGLALWTLLGVGIYAIVN